MSDDIWTGYLTEQDRAVLKASGYGVRGGFGKRPALLVIDVNYAFCGERPEPIVEAIRKWRTSCGAVAWDAIAVTQPLLDAARRKGVPVIYTTSDDRPSNWYAGAWAYKSSRSFEATPESRPNIDGSEIVAEIAPQPQDIVVKKQKPSAFFGTPLLSFLVQLGVDSLIIMGTTTSGCVRASVIDAFSHNYRTALVADATFDRFESSHAVNLFDINAKYADVVKSDEVLAFIETLEPGQFVLPA